MIIKTGQELIIRKAQPEDAENILEYLKIVGEESDNLLFGGGGVPITVEQESNFINIANSSEKSCMLIGIVDNIIVSVASMSGNTRARIAHLGELAISVRKDYWNSGVGSAMMKALIDFAMNASIEVIELKVKTDNIYAVKLYEKFGFKKIGTYEKFFKINDVYYDSYLMNLYL